MKVSFGFILVAVAALISVAWAQTDSSAGDEQNKTTTVREGLKLFQLDRECAMVGGICMTVDDCDPEFLSTTRGLCPSNAHNGVECCYRYKARDNSSCDQYQGECMSYCHRLLRHKSNDCGDQWCCTLV